MAVSHKKTYVEMRYTEADCLAVGMAFCPTVLSSWVGCASVCRNKYQRTKSMDCFLNHCEDDDAK